MKLSEIRKNGIQDKTESEALPEVSQGDVVGIPLQGKIAEIIPLVETAIHDYMDKFGIENLKKESLTVWGAMCNYVGLSVFKHTDRLRDKETRIAKGGFKTNFNAYDYDVITQLLNYYTVLCGSYDKHLTVWDFADFCGIGYSVFIKFADRLNPAASVLYKKTEIQAAHSWISKDLQRGGVNSLAASNFFIYNRPVQDKNDQLLPGSVDDLPD